MTDLFAPFRLGPLELANRFVMAPLTRNRAGAGEAPTALHAEYYAQRATAGLIISEGTQPSRRRPGLPAHPRASTPTSRSPAGAWSPTPCTPAAAASSPSSCTPAASATPTSPGCSPSRRPRSRPPARSSPREGMQAFRRAARARDRRAARRRRGVRRRRPPRRRGRPRRRRAARRQRLPAPPVPRRRQQPAHRRLRRQPGEPRPLRRRGRHGRGGGDRRRPRRHPHLARRHPFNDIVRDRGRADLRRARRGPRPARPALPARARGPGHDVRRARCASRSTARSSSTRLHGDLDARERPGRRRHAARRTWSPSAGGFIANPDLVERLRTGAELNEPDAGDLLRRRRARLHRLPGAAPPDRTSPPDGAPGPCDPGAGRALLVSGAGLRRGRGPGRAAGRRTRPTAPRRPGTARPRRRRPGRSCRARCGTTPAAAAASAAPIWWLAKTQPKTSVPCSPNSSRQSVTVGGTVATQSRP